MPELDLARRRAAPPRRRGSPARSRRASRRSARRRGRGTRRTPPSACRRWPGPSPAARSGRRRGRGCRRAGRRGGASTGPACSQRGRERRRVSDGGHHLGRHVFRHGVGEGVPGRVELLGQQVGPGALGLGHPRATTCRGGPPGSPRRRARRAGELGVHRGRGGEDAPALVAGQPAVLAEEGRREVSHHHPPAVAVARRRYSMPWSSPRASARRPRPATAAPFGRGRGSRGPASPRRARPASRSGGVPSSSTTRSSAAPELPPCSSGASRARAEALEHVGGHLRGLAGSAAARPRSC